MKDASEKRANALVVELDTITASDAVGSGSSPDGCTKKRQAITPVFFLSVVGENPHYLQLLSQT